MHGEASPLGLLGFLSFCFSIIAAVLAIDMYRLLRTGEFGRTWRLLIIASVMLALLQVLRMAETIEFRALDISRLVQIVELCFIMSLAYAFYLQRKLFTNASTRSRHHSTKNAHDEARDEKEYSDAGAYYDEEPYEGEFEDEFEGDLPNSAAPDAHWPESPSAEKPEPLKR